MYTVWESLEGNLWILPIQQAEQKDSSSLTGILKLQWLSTSFKAWELRWPSLRCQIYTESGTILLQSTEETVFMQAGEDISDQNWRLGNWY